MDATTLKSAAYEQIARMGKALAHGHRLEILDLLAHGPRTVEAVARETGMSIANASAHLQRLRAVGLIRGTKRGSYVTYQLTGPDVMTLLGALRASAEQHLATLDDIRQAYLLNKEALEAIDRRELLGRIERNEVVLLDVRPEEEYEHTHLAQALSIPLEDLEQRLRQLPNDKLIVAYCRGPYCLLAVEAVKLLHAHGFAARQLKDGVREWQAAGLPLERGPRAPRPAELGVS